MTRLLSPVLAALVVSAAVVVAWGASDVAQARVSGAQSGSSETVALAELPGEARQTHRLILAGGPFPYPHKDGSVFGNRERMLPVESRGFYREYTVPTPQSRDRGARRIICGGIRPTVPAVCFYTQDHYTSFRRIVQ
jgi:ribonuclease T1